MRPRPSLLPAVLLPLAIGLGAHGRSAAVQEDGPERRAAALEGPWDGVVMELHIEAGTSGPGSPACGRSLARAAERGARCVLFRVHLAPPEPGSAAVATLGGDDAWRAAVAQARSAGLRVALLVEALSSPSGPRDGERVLTSDADWEGFFEWTATAVEHVARLAEETGVELLVIGAGLSVSASTAPPRGKPDNERFRAQRAVRMAGWRRVIARARSSFSGALAYGSESAGSARSVGFWSELDAAWIGLFPDLTSRRGPDPPGDDALRQRLESAVRRALDLRGELGLPILLETGARARRRADRGPSSPGEGVDAQAQARRLRLLAEVLESRADDPALLGVWLRGWGIPPGETDPMGWALDGRPARIEALFR